MLAPPAGQLQRWGEQAESHGRGGGSDGGPARGATRWRREQQERGSRVAVADGQGLAGGDEPADPAVWDPVPGRAQPGLARARGEF